MEKKEKKKKGKIEVFEDLQQPPELQVPPLFVQALSLSPACSYSSADGFQGSALDVQNH